MVVHQNITNLAGYFHFLNVRKIPYVIIFEEELAGWYTDEEAWPKKMDLRLFKQWFHVKVHEIVLDIGKKLPIAEEY